MPKRVGKTHGTIRPTKGSDKLPSFSGKVKSVGKTHSFQTNRRPGTGSIPRSVSTGANGPKMYGGGQRVSSKIGNMGERFLGK